MYYSLYIKQIHYLKKYPVLINALLLFNKLVTLSGYLIYPLIILYLWTKQNPRLIQYILIPGITFVGVSVFRKIFNRTRPYENPDYETLTKREKKGQSFPSRHVFSYSLIGILLYGILPQAGIIMMVFTLILAYLRVILGIHYASDVFAGACLGILSGILTIII